MGQLRRRQAHQQTENRNNILAIHGLNVGLGSSDMLINAELSLGQRSGAEVADGVLKYTSPIRLTADTTVRARSMHNGQWSALVEHSFQAGRAGSPLRFTEIMYNPPGGSEYEFVELHNSGTFDVPLGWHRFDGIDFTFDGDAVIGPGEFLVLASDNDPDAFKLRYPGRLWPAGFGAACRTTVSALRCSTPSGGESSRWTTATAKPGQAWPTATATRSS